jgi:5-methylcytosine-specific restriction endonuclease McrA
MLFCHHCKQEMTPGTRGRKKKFCSDDCSRMSRRKLPVETSCWSCGEALTDLGKSGFPKRYCNRKCAQDLRIRQEQEARDLRATCKECGVNFVGDKQGLKYCGQECRAEANRKYSARRWREEVATRPEFKEWECAWCNEMIRVPISFTGHNKYHDECKLRARRARDRRKTLRRQGVKSVERITHEEIAERDGYLCHICGDSVDMSLPRTSKLGATLDHVIPVSKGGVDSRENLKLAHWICNVKKSNRIGDELVASEA